MPRTATSDTVSHDDLLAFLRTRHHALLLTYRQDGSPQLSPVSAGVDPQGRVVVATYPQRAKTKNARRDERVSLCFLSEDWDGPWVQVDGTAEVLDVPEALDAFVDYYRSIAGEHPDWEEYRAAMVKQGKSLVRVTLERWGPVATGGFPPELAAPA
jgi:PPOX class probable F420-dependent enzyme